MKIRLAALLVLTFGYLLLPVAAHAQYGYSEQIDSFDSNATLTTENQLNITETIDYNFGVTSRHGIYREVPSQTQAGTSDKYYYYDIEWGEVLQDGQPAKVKKEFDGRNYKIRIGDEDITINGTHTYVINYTLSPIAEKDGEDDFINLNITGNEWNVPINKVTSTLTIEGTSTIIDEECFTGVYNSTASNCKIKASDNSVSTSAAELSPYEGLTINVLTTNGNLATYLEPQSPPPFDFIPFTPIIVGIVGLVLGIILRIFSYVRHRIRKKDETIVPQYSAPKDVSVGEMGVLYDNVADMKEITGTLIDLAVRGYIRITQTQEKSLFKSAKYQFDLLKQVDTKLAAHEQDLLKLLFEDGKTTIDLKDVDKTKAGSTVTKVKNELATKLEGKGFRLKPRKLASQKYIARLYLLASLATVVLAAVLLFTANSKDQPTSAPITMGITSLVLLAIGFAISTRIEISPTGYKKWAEIEGLVLYLTVAEKDRLKFHDAPEKNPQHFSELLPAAIALGVDKQWASQFKDLDVSENVDWYSGRSSGFNSMMLANSLSRDLNSAVSSSFTPPSQSSSGMGGGFSGGGGGGGGGGSW